MRIQYMMAKLAIVVALFAVHPLVAQEHAHVAGMTHPDSAASVTGATLSSGQAAFAAIAELVARLEKDPTTDWSRVNFEALRLHLIDMDNMTMKSRIVTTPVPGGFSALVTGEGDAVGSIRRMAAAHARQVATEGPIRAEVVEIPGGVRMVVTGGPATDSALEARIRGLGVIGIMTLGNHHGPHHEGMARGLAVHAH